MRRYISWDYAIPGTDRAAISFARYNEWDGSWTMVGACFDPIKLMEAKLREQLEKMLHKHVRVAVEGKGLFDGYLQSIDDMGISVKGSWKQSAGYYAQIPVAVIALFPHTQYQYVVEVVE